MAVQYSVAVRNARSNARVAAIMLNAVAWAASTAYAAGAKVYANGNIYNCTTAGTSASSGTGPSGTGTGIADNTAVWAYYGNVQLLLYTGAPPASCATAASGTLLATLTLPLPFQTQASAGADAIANGPWTGKASVAGTAGYYRLVDAAGTVHEQGTAGQNTGDLPFDNPVLAVNQAINVNGWTVTEPQA